ncbi:S-adenosyl-L-methionine-dependent methyltransferase [Naematelia encephala]|uniref:S-adenosyl-L-methionine-dependent methyltransferase n=1 Tax=Naematelia encephala TaxID=71784 RepID=A0A1Y2AX67_9TREE|nr:S-adenosyl-L-methionine-dependent methyltransferase [Naematelia encephala]
MERERTNRQTERKSSGSQTASGVGSQDRCLNLSTSSPTTPAWNSEHVLHLPASFKPSGGASEDEQVRKEGWRILHSPRAGSVGKKIWVDKYGQDIAGVYRVGWEREVLDLLHETMYEMAGRHTFVDDAPTAVLDIGTGIGLWPISQALIWPQTTFVGLDPVPCQVDLTSLAWAERKGRCASVRRGQGIWEGVEKRIAWERANFLEPLRYEAGVFDMVHIRFVGLGVPETKWGDLLDEATRVLKPGGKLEIIETSYTLPSACPPSLRNSFASLLLADLVQPIPLLPLRLVLSSTPGLKATFEPVYERTWTNPPDALRDAIMVRVTSSLACKATGIVRKRQSEDGLIRRVQRELHLANSKKWANHSEELQGPSSGDRRVSVWAWVGVKG